MHTYQYPRAALTVDCVVFGFDEGELEVLLIQRALEPFKGKWALPGGFVKVDETLDEAARRELARPFPRERRDVVVGVRPDTQERDERHVTLKVHRRRGRRIASRERPM